MVGSTLAFGVVLWRGVSGQWPFYRLKQWLSGLGLLVALATGPMLLIVANAHHGHGGWAATLTLACTMWTTAYMLNAVRGALLGYSFGFAFLAPVTALAWGVPVLPILAAVVPPLFFLVLKARVVGRIDYAGARARARAFGQGQQAVKMIAEFEEHGTGWFWETDRHGRLTYLSEKVAHELAASGIDSRGQLLTELFQMDPPRPAPSAPCPSTWPRAPAFRTIPSARWARMTWRPSAGGRSRAGRSWTVSAGFVALSARARPDREASIRGGDHPPGAVRQPDRAGQSPAHDAVARQDVETVGPSLAPMRCS